MYFKIHSHFLKPFVIFVSFVALNNKTLIITFTSVPSVFSVAKRVFPGAVAAGQ